CVRSAELLAFHLRLRMGTIPISWAPSGVGDSARVQAGGQHDGCEARSRNTSVCGITDRRAYGRAVRTILHAAPGDARMMVRAMRKQDWLRHSLCVAEAWLMSFGR